MDQAGSWIHLDMCACSYSCLSATPSFVMFTSLSIYIPYFFQVASDCIWSDPASEVMERSLDETGFGDSPRGGGAVWYVFYRAYLT